MKYRGGWVYSCIAPHTDHHGGAPSSAVRRAGGSTTTPADGTQAVRERPVEASRLCSSSSHMLSAPSLWQRRAPATRRIVSSSPSWTRVR